MELLTSKKGVMNQIVGVFILVMVVSVIAGMTFLFISSLKTNVLNSSTLTTSTVSNETGFVNASGYPLSHKNDLRFTSPSITEAFNATDDSIIGLGNLTVSATGTVTNTTAVVWDSAKISYTYKSLSSQNSAYLAVNTTEAAGATVVNYLPLLFLALIFGAILIVTLRVILPYINLGSQLGSGF